MVMPNLSVVVLAGRTFPVRRIPTRRTRTRGVTPLSARSKVFSLTLGASYDSYRSSIFPIAIRFNPKLGLTWEIAPGSLFRAAYFEGLKRTVVAGQTIEPTQISRI